MTETTPPTDKATLETCDDKHRLSDEQIDRICEDLSYGSSTLERDACTAITQLRTSLAAANKRAEEANGRCEDLAAYINRINARLNDQRNNSLNLEAERDILRTQLAEAKAAANTLYDAGHWTCDRNVDAESLWSRLRDAVGREPGSAPEPLKETCRILLAGENEDCKQLRTQLAEAKEALEFYADQYTWQQSFQNHNGRSEPTALEPLGSMADSDAGDLARRTLSRLTKANTQENKEE